MVYVFFPHLDNNNDLITFKFLIDTGASVSLIKTDKLKQTPLYFNPNDKVMINGICPNKQILTTGSVNLEPIFDGYKTKIKFHIVKGPTNIPFDGLLGNDFLLPGKAEINLNQLNLKINCLPVSIKIFTDIEQPFINEPQLLPLSNNQIKKEAITLNPQSETFIEVNIVNNITEGITPEIKICNGVFIAKAILKVTNKKAITSIVNTTDKAVKINFINLALEEFVENDSYVFHNSVENYNLKNSATSRFRIIQENLKL